MKSIHIGTLLDHLSTDAKEVMLRAILNQAFLSKDGNISPEQPRPGNPIEFIQGKLAEAIDVAEKNIAELAKVNAEDECLDDPVTDSFDEMGSETNNGGAHEQAKFLIVEKGWTAEQVNQSAEEFERSLSEIPR